MSPELFGELVAALMLLTRLPVARLAGPAGAPEAAIWAYPPVGALVGGIGGGLYWMLVLLRLPPAIGAIGAIAAMIFVTGALHEDGLADTADGFGGGVDRAAKLAIMRDSRIGSFGTLALLLSTAARIAAVAAIGAPGAAMAALVAAGGLGRAAILVMLLLLRPARADGLAAELHTTRRPRAAFGLFFATGLAATLLAPAPATGAAGAALCVAMAIAWLARRQIGGYTGDALGAVSVLAETAVLVVLA